jgi:pimeloyl-ACP methyl ester carboxylesterase
MTQLPSALWLTTSPSFRKYDQPLLRRLSWHSSIAQWEYHQSPDESSSLETALVFLHDYLKHSDRPVHLLGHSTSGLLGLLYARRYPKRVRSLTLLAVGVHPAIDWQAFYHVHLKLLPCSRQTILMQMVQNLFGYQCLPIAHDLCQALEHDLQLSLSPHTVFQRAYIASGKPDVPLLVCGSANDVVVPPHEIEGWREWLGEDDRLWLCPQGHHFFHFFCVQAVARQVLNFWTLLTIPERLSPEDVLIQ